MSTIYRVPDPGSDYFFGRLAFVEFVRENPDRAPADMTAYGQAVTDLKTAGFPGEIDSEDVLIVGQPTETGMVIEFSLFDTSGDAWIVSPIEHPDLADLEVKAEGGQ